MFFTQSTVQGKTQSPDHNNNNNNNKTWLTVPIKKQSTVNTSSVTILNNKPISIFTFHKIYNCSGVVRDKEDEEGGGGE